MNKQILIIEDDRFLAGLLEKKLVLYGFEIKLGVDSQESFKILKESKIDCILLDLLLPGEDGFAVLQRIKSDPGLKDIPVLVISNLSGAEDKEKALKLGARDFLVKAEHSPESIARKVESCV